MNKKCFIPDEKSMLALGARIARAAKPGDIIYLEGNLGAGKTTLTRGFLRYFKVKGTIKSPTYTLIETYELKNMLLYHFDFYRLKHPDELKNIGLSDYLTENAICLIEWPERVSERLPKAHICCKIEIPEEGQGRWVSLTADRNIEDCE